MRSPSQSASQTRCGLRQAKQARINFSNACECETLQNNPFPLSVLCTDANSDNFSATALARPTRPLFYVVYMLCALIIIQFSDSINLFRLMFTDIYVYSVYIIGMIIILICIVNSLFQKNTKIIFKCFNFEYGERKLKDTNEKSQHE